MPKRPATHGARVHRQVWAPTWAIAACALVAGCASAPPPAPVAPAVPAPAQPSLAELMKQGQTAARDGQRDKARMAWRAATRAYPTEAQPWQRLAEDFFNTADYGNAILAAQEVLLRDSQDTLAHSVLAVSGLRVSTVSLLALRERSSFRVGSREEAAGLTRALRDALGEATLVPQRAEAPEAASAPTVGRRTRTARGSAGTAAPTGTATAPPVAPALAAAAAPPAPSAPAPTPRTSSATARSTAATPSPTPATKTAGDPFKLLN